MTTRRWLFGDQLGPHFLDDSDQPVLMIESKAVFARRTFHRAEGTPRAVGDAAPRGRARRSVRVCTRRPPIAMPSARRSRCAIRHHGLPSGSSNPSTASRCCPHAASPRRRADFDLWAIVPGREAAAARGLLPRRTPPTRRADGRQPNRPAGGGTSTPTTASRRRSSATLGVAEPWWPDRGRDRRRGAPRPRRVGARRRRQLHRHDGPRRFAATRAEALHVLRDVHRPPAAVVRRARGRDAARRRLDGALAAVGAAQPRPARSARGRPARRVGLPRRRCADRVRRGVRAADHRLARLRLAPVLAPVAMRTGAATRSQRPAPCRSGSPTLDADETVEARCLEHVLARCARARLGAPHPAADGARQLRDAARLASHRRSPTGSTARSSTATTG